MKKLLFRLFKITVGASILVYLFSKVDFDIFIKTISKINYLYFILAVIIIFLGVFLSSFKWFILLKSKEIKVTYLKTVKLYFTGNFFNSFLPGMIGGDLVKIYGLKKNTKKFEDIISATFMDRFLGLIALLTIGFFGILFNLKFFLDNKIIIFLFITLIFLIIIFLIFLFNESLLKKFEKIYVPLLNVFKFINLKEKFDKFYSSSNSFKNRWKTLILIYFIALIFQSMVIFINYFVSLSVNLGVELKYFFVFVPIISCLIMIPISFQGIGIREGLNYFFYSKVGASLENIIIYSLLLYFAILFINFLGGFVYLFDNIMGGKYNKQFKKEINSIK